MPVDPSAAFGAIVSATLIGSLLVGAIIIWFDSQPPEGLS